MGLWLVASFPALILVLSFIRFSFRQFSGALGMPHLVHARNGGLTNDGVVVAGELPCLDFGFEFHTILLSSQPPHGIPPPGVAIISDQILVPRERLPRWGSRLQNCTTAHSSKPQESRPRPSQQLAPRSRQLRRKSLWFHEP